MATWLAVGSGLAILVGAWFVAAWRAGLGTRGSERVPGPEGDLDAFSQRKRVITVPGFEVALVEAGEGEPLLLLHGCPFHSYEWHRIIDRLAAHYHVIAPDLLGLGDTPVRLDDDYRLPKDMQMVLALLDALGVDAAHIVGHDHGGATLQLLMAQHPERVRSATLTNAEAYDQWPSDPERPYLKLLVWRLTSPLLRLALKLRLVQREAFGNAVYQPECLDAVMLNAFVRPHVATPARWQRLKRFAGWQVDPGNNRETLRAVPGLKRFDKPTLILWGRRDTNFGPAVAERLARDIPGARGIIWLESSAHLPMLEEPVAYAEALERFLAGVEAALAARRGDNSMHAQTN